MLVAGAGFGYENQEFEISYNSQNHLKPPKTLSNSAKSLALSELLMDYKNL